MREGGTCFLLAAGAPFERRPVFGHLQGQRREIQHLGAGISRDLYRSQVLLAALTDRWGQGLDSSGLFDHQQRVPWMTWLPTALLATHATQTLGCADRGLGPITGGGFTTIVAIFADLALQTFDAVVQLRND